MRTKARVKTNPTYLIQAPVDVPKTMTPSHRYLAGKGTAGDLEARQRRCRCVTVSARWLYVKLQRKFSLSPLPREVTGWC